jgi:hypothetical protein
MATYAQHLILGPFFSGGNLQGSAKLFHYAAGTTTDKDIYSDRGKTTPLAQPFVSDSQGIFSFFADGLYKFVLKTSADVELYTWDNVLIQDFTAPSLAEGASLPSASTLAVGPEIWAHVTGSTTITGLSGTIPWFWAIFDGDLTLTHSGSLILPGSRNRRMLAGDAALFLNEGSSVWRLAGHMEKEGGYLGRKGADIAAAATLSLGADGGYFHVTGGTTITAISARDAGQIIVLEFDGTPSLTHHATSLILSGGLSYQTVAGDVLVFLSEGSGNWREIGPRTLEVERGGTSNRTGEGLVYGGPSAMGSGSTRTHEGAVTVTTNGNYSGVHYYSTFTLNSSVTMTVPTGDGFLAIVASQSITINGTIAGNGAGFSAPGAAVTSVGPGLSGGNGTGQPAAGGGADNSTNAGGAGGGTVVAGLVVASGGAGGAPPSSAGGSPTGLTGSLALRLLTPMGFVGGASGGSGGLQTGTSSGGGGRGGADIILIAPSITLAATATINTSGANGGTGSGGTSGGGGGGGAGNIWIVCRSYTDNGATFTQTGGSAGSGSGGAPAGGAGADGFKQILDYI